MPRGLLPVGRPDREVQNFRWKMQRRFMEVTTTEDLDKIIRTGLDKAAAGDVQWAGLILPWLLGKPPKSEDDQAQASIQVGGDINIAMNQLSDDQLAALAALKQRTSYHTIDAAPDPQPEPVLPEPAPADR